MKTLIIFLIILFSSIPAIAFDLKDNKIYSFTDKAEWSKTEKSLFMSYTGSTILDSLQTINIFKNPEKYHERNDVIRYMVKKTGKSSIPIYFILLNLFHYKVADHLSHKWRKGYLIGINCFSYDAVRKNYVFGVKFNY